MFGVHRLLELTPELVALVSLDLLRQDALGVAIRQQFEQVLVSVVVQQFDGDDRHSTHTFVPVRAVQLDVEASLRVRAVPLQHLDVFVLVAVQIALKGVNERRQELGAVLPDETEKYRIVNQEECPLSHAEVQRGDALRHSLDQVVTNVDQRRDTVQQVKDAFELCQAAHFLVRVNLGPVLDARQDGLVCQRLVLLDVLAYRFDQLLAELRQVLLSVHWQQALLVDLPVLGAQLLVEALDDGHEDLEVLGDPVDSVLARLRCLLHALHNQLAHDRHSNRKPERHELAVNAMHYCL